MDDENKKVKDIPRLPNGKPVMGPNTGVKFSSTYQASPEAKSKGLLKRRIFKELMDQPLIKNDQNSKLIELAASYLQIPEDQITWPDIMHVAQIRKAVRKADTFAYVAVMDRIAGKPASKMTLANDENNPITPLDANQVQEFLSKIKSGGVGEGLNVSTSNIQDAEIIEDQTDK